MIFR